jgi:hypothetical protein
VKVQNIETSRCEHKRKIYEYKFFTPSWGGGRGRLLIWDY